MKKIKGIILAGGFGSRLYPLTISTSKHLLPVYDKPMIYYPLSVLMNSGIRDVLIICTKKDLANYKYLLKDGSQIGMNFYYKIQDYPSGIAESFIIGEEFIGESNVSLILGDNIFHGKNFTEYLNQAKQNLINNISSVFGVRVNNPKEFGVIEFNNNGSIKIIEKPEKTKSDLIVSGLYFYTNDVINFSKKLNPSKRGELEISDINNVYINLRRLNVIELDKTISWIDTGTHNSLVKASHFFRDIEINTSKKVACIEELAFKLGLINKNELINITNSMKTSSYGKYLNKIISNEDIKN